MKPANDRLLMLAKRQAACLDLVEILLDLLLVKGEYVILGDGEDAATVLAATGISTVCHYVCRWEACQLLYEVLRE